MQNFKDITPDLTVQNCYSPDLALIQAQFDFVPLFVYGTHKQKFSDNGMISEYPRYGLGVTTNPNLVMFNHGSMNYPVVLDKQMIPEAEPAKVSGEIYLVSPECIFQLDKHFQNTVFFRRSSKQIQWYDPNEKDKKVKTSFLSQCLMYTGIGTVWRERVQQGHLVLSRKIEPNSKAKPYYLYQHSDDRKTTTKPFPLACIDQ